MKTIYAIKLLLLMVILFLPSACSEEFLDVENPNQLTTNEFFTTGEDFQRALNASYVSFMSSGLFGLNYYLYFNSFDDRILFETPNLDNIQINAGSNAPRDAWKYLYQGLFRTTKILVELKDISGVSEFSEEEAMNVEAQARALRGSYYFYLVTLFNRPVYYDETTFPQMKFTDNMTNGEPEQFFDQMETDFTFAINHLKEEYDDANVGKITRNGALAMYAKMLLYKHYHFYAKNGNKGSQADMDDLKKGIDALNQIFSSGKNGLMQPQGETREDYIYAFLCNFSYVDLVAPNGNVYKAENNKESLWEIQFANTESRNFSLPGWMATGHRMSQYFSPSLASYKNHEIHPALWGEFETTGVPDSFNRDPRAFGTVYVDGDLLDFRPDQPNYRAFNPVLHTKRIAANRGIVVDDPFPGAGAGLKKYYFPVYQSEGAEIQNDPTNRRIIRYADALLMHAELKLLYDGDADGTGLASLNAVRARSGMDPIPTLTTDAIIHERDVELATEGYRFFDLIRWSFDSDWGIDWVEIFGDSRFTVGKNEYYPIPTNEIDVNNGQLKQNPNW